MEPLNLPFQGTKKDVAAIRSAVNTRLLQCAALVEAGATDNFAYAKALDHANEALAIVETSRRCELIPRVQMARGRCFQEMGMWHEAHEAHEAYVRATRREVLSLEVEIIAPFSGEKMVEEEARKGVAMETKKMASLAAFDERRAVDGHESFTPNTPSKETFVAKPGRAKEILLIRDGHGQLVDVREGLPKLRSVKGLGLKTTSRS